MNQKTILPIILTILIFLLPATSAGRTAANANPQPSNNHSTLAYDDWWTAVQTDIQQSEYHIIWQEQTALVDIDAAYQAPNRAQNLRTYFTSHGLRLIPRAYVGERPPWEWGLALSRYGPETAVQPAPLHASDNRLEYRRGAITERYLNDERGLEQSFTLAAPPGEKDDSVILALNWSGDLQPALSSNGQVIEWTTAGGVRVLLQGGLLAYDADGRDLPVQMRLDEEQSAVELVVEAAGAIYPVTIVLLVNNPDWSAESNQSFANFGWSVGTAGDVNGDGYSEIIVGAFGYDNGQNEEGRAYVYHGSADGLSMTPAWITESDQNAAFYGYSVGTAGDVNGDGYSDVIVGAHLYDNDQTNDGQVYVYHGSAAGLSTTANWIVDGDQAGGNLGSSVGTAGDVNGDGYSDVIVGARWYDNGQINEGRAYVYHGSAAGLSTTAAWMAESNQEGADVGRSVSTAGDVNGDGYSDVIVGALLYDNGQEDEGRAYVYHGSAAGLSPTAAWTSEGDQVQASLGSSVGTAGDVNGDGYSDVVVGAPGYWDSHPNEGRAYVYHGSAAGLSTTANWTAETNQNWTILGTSVGTAGDVNGDGYADVILGAPYYDDSRRGLANAGGAVYVYYGSETGLAAAAGWTIESEQDGAEFGWSAGTAGDVNGDGYSDIIVGAHFYSGGQTEEGRAYVYHGGAMGLADTAAWTAESNQSEANFGYSVGTAGDVNGDGYSDVIAGARYYDNGQTEEGRAYLYYGSADGLSTTAAWIAEINQAGALFGSSAGTAGDVNGDGYSDVIVGAPYYANGGQPYEGGVFVYYGSATGVSTVAVWQAEGNQPEAEFGRSVGTAGDVNGDGYSDIIIGSPWYDGGNSNEGRAYIYYGSEIGLPATATQILESDINVALFGYSVGTAGDVNGDGYSDVIIGAPYYNFIPLYKGQAYVYYGSADGASPIADWMVESDQDGASFGWSVGTAGDVNGDGYSDVIIGEPFYETDGQDEGRAFLYHGSPTGLGDVSAWMAEGSQYNGRYGFSVGTAGDVNGDGYSDAIIGAATQSNGQEAEGLIYVHYGSPVGISVAADWIAESNQEFTWLGNSVGAAGDINGDAYGDIIAGAPWYQSGQLEEGRAFVYYGNGGDGLHMLPRQRRSDDSTPISLLGLSDSPTAVRLSLIGRMPLGREEVKLQWQVAPLGTPITAGNAITGVSPAWIDTPAGGVEINQIVTGLEPGRPYHWRVRLLYRPGNALGQPAGRWIHIPWNGWNETDLRTSRFLFWDYLPVVFCSC